MNFFPSQHLLPLPLEKADKRVTRWMKLCLINKAQADRYMSKQLTRIGGKFFGKYRSRRKC